MGNIYIYRKHLSSPYLVERLFLGTRSAREVVSDLMKVHRS